MNKKKKILLIIIIVSLGLLCFNNKILNALAKEYTGQSQISVGEIYKSGDTINYSIIIENMDEYPGFYIYLQNDDGSYIWCSTTNEFGESVNTDCGTDDSINKTYTFPTYPDDKTAYWIITKGSEGMNYQNYIIAQYYNYTAPTLSVTCDDATINSDNSTNCSLDTTYSFPLKQMDFSLSSTNSDISNIDLSENWTNSSINGNYTLTAKNVNDEATMDNPITEQLATFKVTPNSEIINKSESKTLEDTILVNNITYTDNATEDTIDDAKETLTINIENKTAETAVENPKTGNKLNYFIASLILIACITIIIIIGKKKSLFLK